MGTIQEPGNNQNKRKKKKEKRKKRAENSTCERAKFRVYRSKLAIQMAKRFFPAPDLLARGARVILNTT